MKNGYQFLTACLILCKKPYFLCKVDSARSMLVVIARLQQLTCNAQRS